MRFQRHRLTYAEGWNASFQSYLLEFHVWTGAYARFTLCYRVGHPWRRFLGIGGCINIGDPKP